MAAATQARNTSQFAGEYLNLPVKGGEIIFAGTLAALDADGYAKPGEKAEGLTAAGRAEETVDNRDGGDGDASIRVARGAFKWDNDAANPVDIADVLQDCYMLDDSTVTALATGSSKAGKVLGIDQTDGGVIVETR